MYAYKVCHTELYPIFQGSILEALFSCHLALHETVGYNDHDKVHKSNMFPAV